MTTDSTIKLRRLDVPACDPGATLPLVLMDETRMVFGYRLAHDVPRSLAVFVVDHVVTRFGYPNDEALAGHRYIGLGLGYYSAYEVIGSEWLAEISAANRVGFPNAGDIFRAARHFIFTFHDSTLEFVADELPQAELGDGLLLDEVLARFRR